MLSGIRQKVLERIRSIPLPPIGQFLTPGVMPMLKITSQVRPSLRYPKSTNCGALPGWIALELNGKHVVKLPSGDTSITSYMTDWKGFTEKLERDKGLPPESIWIPYKPGRLPQPGDIYPLYNGSQFAHVGIIIDAQGRDWITADSGQGPDGPLIPDPDDPEPDPKKKKKILKYAHGFGAGYRRRSFKNGMLTGEGVELHPPERILSGWVNIDHPVLFPDWATTRKPPKPVDRKK